MISKTQYHAVCVVAILLNYLQNINTDSDFNKGKKIVCLMMLLSVTQVNTLIHLKVTNMYITDTECTLIFDEVLEHILPKYVKNLNIQSISRVSRVVSSKKRIKLYIRCKINKIITSSTFYFRHKSI